MNLNVFYKKWQGKTVEDYGAYMSPSAKNFASNIKAVVKEIAINNGAVLERFNTGHYYIFGMISKDGRYIYFSREIERYDEKIDLNKGSTDGILIRSAKNTKDYTGGRNHFCNFQSFKENMNNLFDNPDFR